MINESIEKIKIKTGMMKQHYLIKVLAIVLVFSVLHQPVFSQSIPKTAWRSRNDLPNDFAARMDWTTKLYNECNPPPVLKEV